MNNISIPQSEIIVNKISEFIQNQDTKEFNKRDSGLKLKTFLLALTASLCSMGKVTLEGLAIKCQNLQHGLLSFSKQALCKRLETGKKELRKLLCDTMSETIIPTNNNPKAPLVLEQFAAVNITDATTISLPDKLAKCHKGLGGTNAESALKIQATYDIKAKNFKKIDIIDNATENDVKYTDELLKSAVANELYINDLGYYSVDYFSEMDKKNAYFISKIKTNTVLYTSDGNKIDMFGLLTKSSGINEKVVIKGSKGICMTVRLCGIRLPERVYSKRLRKANKTAKASGKMLTKEEKERLKWMLCITNVDEDVLDCVTVCETYRIRWQIELIFKSWKSHFSIDVMNNVGKDYWDCLIYGKLIVITMLTTLYSRLYYHVYGTLGKQISFLRFMKNIREELGIILEFMTSNKSLSELILILLKIIRASITEKRRRKTTEQAIAEMDLPLITIEEYYYNMEFYGLD